MNKQNPKPDEALANLRQMIAEAREINAKSRDSAKGTKMLSRIVAHETSRSRKRHDDPEQTQPGETTR